MADPRLHDDEVDTGPSLARRLVDSQFPQWAHRPIGPGSTTGTVNVLHRLGDDLVVRLPRVARPFDDVDREARWLDRLRPHLPVAVPDQVAVGRPGEGYPGRWSIYRWIDGHTPDAANLTDPHLLASDLAGFITALQAVDTDGGSGPGGHRGGPLAARDRPTREAIGGLGHLIDVEAASEAWTASLATPAWTGPPVWVHADLSPGNLLLRGGRLSAVLDFGSCGIGDPAADLIVAWNLLPADARATFREAVDVDHDTWNRGRGWALSIALIQLPYYEHTLPTMAADARRTIDQVLADHASTWSGRHPRAKRRRGAVVASVEP